MLLEELGLAWFGFVFFYLSRVLGVELPVLEGSACRHAQRRNLGSILNQTAEVHNPSTRPLTRKKKSSNRASRKKKQISSYVLYPVDPSFCRHTTIRSSSLQVSYCTRTINLELSWPPKLTRIPRPRFVLTAADRKWPRASTKQN